MLLKMITDNTTMYKHLCMRKTKMFPGKTRRLIWNDEVFWSAEHRLWAKITDISSLKMPQHSLAQPANCLHCTFADALQINCVWAFLIEPSGNFCPLTDWATAWKKAGIFQQQIYGWNVLLFSCFICSILTSLLWQRLARNTAAQDVAAWMTTDEIVL